MATENPTDWPQPYPLMDAEPYWAALADERITFQRCDACGETLWPARKFCVRCDSTDLTWHDAAGTGEVWSHSTVMRGPTPTWQAIAPYTVGFIAMDEGYQLFAQIDEPADEIAIGRRVRARFVQRGEATLPVFVFDGEDDGS
ncbi:MAG: OB-fold domain-containing protein [Gordonia sp. (in: high G+C Gram-positive bacteria)]|uniref:Zn-ribbon domain-containing OB-fold protein n=1 Tax=Gordonia sp. (in: high G+C Gram-positive bacteria) TaxID=84139 RepID=UPI0039E63058